MSAVKTEFFDYKIRAAGLTDIGKIRDSNQDAVILCPEIGFYAVSDGMGGFSGGKIAAEFVERAIPKLMQICADEYRSHKDTKKAARLLADSVKMMSDWLFSSANTPRHYAYGATFTGCWLLKNRAIFVNLGDSRGYLLKKYKKQPRRITEDQNLAEILVRNGELSREEAKNHPASSRLTAFVGMQSPAEPEVFTREIFPGDRILLCSDGLYGMVSERDLGKIMRESRSPERVCQKFIERANANGGQDNISAAYLKITV